MTTNEDSNSCSAAGPPSEPTGSHSTPVLDAAAHRPAAGSGSLGGDGEPGSDADSEGRWGRCIALALGVLYVPAMAPLFLGPLGECNHCVETYYQYFPLVPGAIGFSAFGLGDARIALSMALAAAAFALVLWSLRRGGRVTRWVVCVAAVAWVFSQAMWFSLLLRM